MHFREVCKAVRIDYLSKEQLEKLRAQNCSNIVFLSFWIPTILIGAADCWPHFRLLADRDERSNSQFRGNLW